MARLAGRIVDCEIRSIRLVHLGLLRMPVDAGQWVANQLGSAHGLPHARARSRDRSSILKLDTPPTHLEGVRLHYLSVGSERKIGRIEACPACLARSTRLEGGQATGA